MYIKIVGFKCHIDTHYDFDLNSMILLQGQSGSGKSTILQAIYWCLYGNFRSVYNNTGQVKKCSVTLKINQLIIYRQKRPELLKVTITVPKNQNNQEGIEERLEDQVYEDDVAQQIIDRAFGSKELWKSCSYIGQKERCSLLSGTASERLTLLNQLSFDMDNPKEYISRIDQELKTVNNSFLELQAGFTTELDLFTKQLSTKPVKNTLSDIEMEQLSTRIGDMNLEVKG